MKKNKCPKCGNNLAKIIYGMPSSEIMEQVEKKKVYIGGCVITDLQPKYHCYKCNRDYFDNLKDCIDDKKYFYVYVEYMDMPGDKLYCYKSENKNIKKGDIVLVERAREEVYGKVITTKEYTEDNAPYPPLLTKEIIEVHTEKREKNIIELNTRRTDLLDAHKYCYKNKDMLKNDNKCGCFYCCKIFNPSKIEEWCDDNDTALCPYCGIDSIIGESSGYSINDKFLNEMQKYWF